MLAIRVGLQVVRRQARRAGIEPKQPPADGLAVGVNQPGPVTLRGHGESGDAAREVWNAFGEFPQCRGAIGPGPMHVLLDLTPAKRLIDIGPGGDRDLFSGKRKRDRLDDGGAGVDPYEDVASHRQDSAFAARAAELMRPPDPCDKAADVSMSKTCRSDAETPKRSRSPTWAGIGACETATMSLPATSIAKWLWSPSH